MSFDTKFIRLNQNHFGLARQASPFLLCFWFHLINLISKVTSMVFSKYTYHLFFQGCVKAFRSIAALKQHKEYHVTFHPFMCDYCGRFFKRECFLRHHRKSHTEWQWPCDYCEEKFNSRKRFKSHVAAHHPDKIPEIEQNTKMAFFKCTVCSKILPQKTVFMDHMSVHNGVKPHKCKFCEKGFSAKSNLRHHEKIHTGGKKLHCKFCSRTYDDPKALEVHLNRKHKEKLDTLTKTKVAVMKNDSEAILQTATASLSLVKYYVLVCQSSR